MKTYVRITERQTNPNATNGTSLSQKRRDNGCPFRIAIITMGVKLGNEIRGYTRFRSIAERLTACGFDVELITSAFQHWEKAQRNTADDSYQSHPFKIHFIDEPGYHKNLDLGRIYSHSVAARNVRTYLESRFAADPSAFDLIYVEIPPNDVARAAAEVAHTHDIPIVVDINDLWPEAMRMAIDVPVLSDIAFAPFQRDAKQVYSLLDAAVGTSDEYAQRPKRDRSTPYKALTVYVGNDLAVFDEAAAVNRDQVVKPKDEFWVIYTGTLGKSYDLATLITAASLCLKTIPTLRIKILGDGPARATLVALAQSLQAPVDFLGYVSYEMMAAYLVESDATINSLIARAPQSVPTKIGDYLAAGIPLINTGASQEFKAKVERDGFGVNVPAGDEYALAGAITYLALHPETRAAMGIRARAVAEKEFDRSRSYQAIIDLLYSLLESTSKRTPHIQEDDDD